MLGVERVHRKSTLANILDVARAAGVSPMTVSRFFNRPEMLREKTSQRVRRAVDELLYVPNAAARSLVRGRTNIVGLLLPDVTHLPCSAVARGAEDEAHSRGYTLILGNSGESEEREREYLDRLLSLRADGLVLSRQHVSEEGLGTYQDRGATLVLLGRQIDMDVDHVGVDHEAAGRELVRFLVEAGHRRLAVVGHAADDSATRSVLAGYLAEIRVQGLDALPFYEPLEEWDVAPFGAGNVMPDVILAPDRRTARAVLLSLARSRVRVPGDVQVACFCDPVEGGAEDEGLIVAGPDYRALGRTAMRMLIDRIQGFDGPPLKVTSPVEVVVLAQRKIA